MHNSLKFNSLINLKLTQESGQTSQSPWYYENSFKEESKINKYSDVILLNKLDNLPVLIKLSQDENDFDNFNLSYDFLPNFDLNDSCFSFKEINNEIKNKVINIFNLDFDLNSFYKFLSDDEKLAPSVEFCNGLRLFLAKSKFECIISSICSANNSIVRWTKSISKIRETWGKEYIFSNVNDVGKIFYGFPNIANFQNFYIDSNEEYENSDKKYEIENYTKNLKSCGVGYRADYMKKSAQLLLNKIDIEEIGNMEYNNAFKTISELPGVGPKVADCILLYGYGFMEAFPSDVWIKRIISSLYFEGNEISAKKTREFGIDHFGDYAGYAQLYLFHFARKSGLMDKLKK